MFLTHYLWYQYSRTSCMRQPKMQKFSGCLWEVVLCKWLLMRIEPQGSLLRRGPYTSPDTFLAQNLLSATSNVRIRVAPCCHWNFFIYSGVIVHTANLDTTPLACVAWQFRLGLLSNKGGWGQRNSGEIGEGATWKYFSHGFASCAWLDKTAMLHRLPHHGSSAHLQETKNNRKL